MSNVVLIGKPGAGKGTLAKQFEERYGFYILTPGALYRREAELKTEFGLIAKAYWADGNLCPDKMTNELVCHTLRNLNNQNVIFDGYPRSLSQARFLGNISVIDLIIDLNIRDDISIKRLLARREKENRLDDTEEIIKQRLIVYHCNNDEIIKYYSNNLNKYKTVDANLSREEVYSAVEKLIVGK